MQSLQIDQATAQEIYPEADPIWKKIFNATFGEATFKKKRHFTEITTWEILCEETGINPSDLYYNGDIEHEMWGRRIELLSIGLNPKGWKADYKNKKQAKFHPWFEMTDSGFRFGGSGDSSADTGSGAGSRHSFASEKECEWHAKKHEGLYRDLMVIEE